MSDASSDEEEKPNSKGDEEMRTLDEIKLEPKKAEDDPFTLSFSTTTLKSTSSSSNNNDETAVVVIEPRKDLFVPHQRRSSYLQFHKGYLYLYGGKFEDKNGREFTFNDMYCLNLKKLDEWRVVYEDREISDEIKKAAAAAEAAKDDDDDDESSGEEDDEDEDESDMEIDAPAIEANESVEKYFERTEEVWMTQAQVEFPDEKSKKLLKRMALELCTLFWTQNTKK